MKAHERAMRWPCISFKVHPLKDICISLSLMLQKSHCSQGDGNKLSTRFHLGAETGGDAFMNHAIVSVLHFAIFL